MWKMEFWFIVGIHPICSPPLSAAFLQGKGRFVILQNTKKINYCRAVAIFIAFRCWQGILFSLCWLLCNTPWIQLTSRRCRNCPGYCLAFCYLYDHRITMLRCLPRLFHQRKVASAVLCELSELRKECKLCTEYPPPQMRVSHFGIFNSFCSYSPANILAHHCSFSHPSPNKS